MCGKGYVYNILNIYIAPKTYDMYVLIGVPLCLDQCPFSKWHLGWNLSRCKKMCFWKQLRSKIDSNNIGFVIYIWLLYLVW